MLTHTQPFNGPMSGTTQVSWYQNKHSPTHTKKKKDLQRHSDNKVHSVGAHPHYGAFSQWELLDPITPAYNKSRPDGRLKLTASAFNIMDQYASSLKFSVSTVMQSLHPLSASPIIARHLLDFMVQGKITEHQQSVGTPPHVDYRCPNLNHPYFYVECPSCCNPPNLSWFETGTE